MKLFRVFITNILYIIILFHFGGISSYWFIFLSCEWYVFPIARCYIGLTNDDEVSKEFRPLKQIIERLNRTFKGNYKPTGGFGAEFGAISSVVLFVAYFNFLRPHSKLDNNVPVLIPRLNDLPNMPAKWLMLIKMSEDYIKSQS